MSTSTFSYAQAAKGHAAAQVTPSQQSPDQSQTPSVAGSQAQEPKNTDISAHTSSVAVSTTSNEIDSSRSTRSASVKPEASGLDVSEANHEDTNTAASVTGSVSSSKVGSETVSSNGVANGTESRGRSINNGSDTGEHSDAKKGRKPKRGKNAEKEVEAGREVEKEAPPPKVELSEAPLPSFNIWEQRQQLHKAKAVDLPPSTVTNPAQSIESKTRPPNSEVVETSRGTPSVKQGSRRDGEPSRNGSNQGPRRTATRGTRANEKQSETNLLANNSASWPTPDTAAVNLKSQVQTQPEKPGKEEKDDGSVAKPKQKKEWVRVTDFVPTVKFETMPQSRGPRGVRAAGSRGGRDNAASQHSANSTERAQDANTGPRPNSGSKRDGAGLREGRKNTPHGEHSRLPKEATTDNTNGELQKSNSGLVNGTNHEQPSRGSVPIQQAEEAVKSSESQKDVRIQSNRDRDTHPQAHNNGNHRNGERTRGGGRSRGGFNQNNPNGIPHYPQSAFTNQQQQQHPHQYPPNNARPYVYGPGYQQVSYPFPGQPGHGQRRSTNGTRGRVNGRVPAMPPMNVPYDTMFAAPMGGGYVPIDPSNELVVKAQKQVEYYFSAENCVKDWYLRQNMDSQGFVDVNIILVFSRMQKLQVDKNVLIAACLASNVVELVLSHSGNELVRVKEGWEQWVIPEMGQRFPGARQDGPSNWLPFEMNNGFLPMMPPHYSYEAPALFSPTSEPGTYMNGSYGMSPINAPLMNGINGHHVNEHPRARESQLSAAVPEFSPSTATFNGANNQDAKAPTQTHLNGLDSSSTNDGGNDQLQLSHDGSPITNGIVQEHASEGH